MIGDCSQITLTVLNSSTLPKQQVLAETVALVTGEPFHSETFSSTPGAYTLDRNQYNRDERIWKTKKNAESFKELKKFIRNQGLVNYWTNLTQTRILDVIIDYLKDLKPTPPPFNRSFLIENLFKKTTNPLVYITNLVPIRLPDADNERKTTKTRKLTLWDKI